MSSKQLTLDEIGTASPDEPEQAPEPSVERESPPDIGDVPNFNREPGRERTELGAALDELCQQAHEYEPTRERGAHLTIGGEEDE